MISWRKLQHGQLKSKDGRFSITETHNDYGDHWILTDNGIYNYKKMEICKNTIIECKIAADIISKLRKEVI
jgi:hypothetical protein